MTIETSFIANIAASVHEMRRAGMSDLMIGACVADVRAAAIHEERHRTEAVARTNPPEFPRGQELCDQIAELIARRDP